jgi:hypothetical protein
MVVGTLVSGPASPDLLLGFCLRAATGFRRRPFQVSGEFFGKGEVMSVGVFRKGLIALGAAVAVAVEALVDGALDQSEGISIVVAFLVAYGVYRVPNKAPYSDF